MAALNISDQEVHELARQLAARTGESMTEAVRKALAERLQRTETATVEEIELRRRRIEESAARLRQQLLEDPRTDDEILGYNGRGYLG